MRFATLACLTIGLGSVPCQAQNARPKIELIGDSTQTDSAGYGRGFCANLTAAVDCVNMARGGASTKTFRELGLWDKAIASHPDFMLIQFGHNDEVSQEHNDRQVPIDGYQQNLRKFIAEARAAGAKPILIAPLTRRYYGKDGKIHSDLTAYCNAMQEVAAEQYVPLIDLQSRSIAYLDSIGEEAGARLGITKKDKDGKVVPDKTHLNWQGSYVFGRMVAEDLGKVEPALAGYVLPTPAALPAEGQLAMRVIQGAPLKIAIVGGNWGKGFCAAVTRNVTCEVMAGGMWAQALAAEAQYYFIEARAGNDLRRMVSDVRAAGAIPVLLSKPANTANTTDLRQSADAVRSIAAREKVTYVDLFGLSSRMKDRNPALVGRAVADNVIRIQVELGPNVIGLPAGATPSAPAPPDGK